MKTISLLIGGILIVLGLMFLQLRSMKKYHPNAELLIGMLKLIDSDSAKK
jgi:hypothetical protein